jgi:hypothetical protein
VDREFDLSPGRRRPFRDELGRDVLRLRNRGCEEQRQKDE